jgi:hypothetical protein
MPVKDKTRKIQKKTTGPDSSGPFLWIRNNLAGYVTAKDGGNADNARSSYLPEAQE